MYNKKFNGLMVCITNRAIYFSHRIYDFNLLQLLFVVNPMFIWPSYLQMVLKYFALLSTYLLPSQFVFPFRIIISTARLDLTGGGL